MGCLLIAPGLLPKLSPSRSRAPDRQTWNHRQAVRNLSDVAWTWWYNNFGGVSHAHSRSRGANASAERVWEIEWVQA
jgi:hypothetical protein